MLNRLVSGLATLKSSRFVRNLSVTFAELILTKGISFLNILLLTRTLGPSDYGKYSFIFVTMTFFAAVFDFGMDNTAVRFAAREKSESDAVFGLYLYAKLATTLIIVVATLIWGPLLFKLSGKEAVIQYIPYLLIGFIGESLFIVNDCYLQAVHRFQLRAILNVLRYVITFLFLGFLWKAKMMTLDLVFFIYFVPVIFTLVFMGKYYRFVMAFIRKPLSKERLKDLGVYEWWMFLFSIANNSSIRIDFFILALFVSYSDLGIYNAALQLCSIISFIPFVFGKVLLPKLSEMPPVEIVHATSRVIKAAMLIALAAALLIPLSTYFIPLFLGQKYIAGIPVLHVLIIGTLVMFLTTAPMQALYSLGKPRILTGIQYIVLTIGIGLNFMLIPRFGIMGAAYSIASMRLLYLALMFIMFNRTKAAVLAEAAALSPSPA